MNQNILKYIFFLNFLQHCNQSQANAVRHLNLIDSIGLMSKFKLVLIFLFNQNEESQLKYQGEILNN